MRGAAIDAFEASEKAYPSYHQVYEIGRLIKARRHELNDPKKAAELGQLIATDYAFGAPTDLLEELRRTTTAPK
jgi:hypothetical protein